MAGRHSVEEGWRVGRDVIRSGDVSRESYQIGVTMMLVSELKSEVACSSMLALD